MSFIVASLSVFVPIQAQEIQVSSGTLKRFEKFPSEYVSPRNIDVWIPDGYDPLKKYDVLYMHDGQMLFDSMQTWNRQEWGVDETVSQLIREKKIRPVIIVGIWNSGSTRHVEYCPQKPFQALPGIYRDSLLQLGRRKDSSIIFKGEIQSDAYLSFIVKELKPYIDRTYSTYADPAHTFIGGSSMGGMISWYAVCEYPEVFGGAICLSTHWTIIYTEKNNLVPASMLGYLSGHLPDPKKHRFYFDFGTATLDTLYEPYQMQANRILLDHGYKFKQWRTVKFPGDDHSERAWRQRLHIPLRFLLKK